LISAAKFLHLLPPHHPFCGDNKNGSAPFQICQAFDQVALEFTFFHSSLGRKRSDYLVA